MAAEPAASMAFSLFFFSNDGSTGERDKYRLVVECARFADSHGLSAVWTPERHFQDFGGLYPNPSVLAAALAMVTERVQIRAGSLVLPLHHPIRVAEDWAVVDNLSGGRVAVSFGSGWNPQDFVLATAPYAERRDGMFRDIQIVQDLWAGKKVRFTDRDGHEYSLGIRPRPLQPSLPVWISIAGNSRTWIRAGQIGANVLTGLNNEPMEKLAAKIQLYREALVANGHRPGQKTVTVMLHTFLGKDEEEVKARTRAPISRYLEGFLGQRLPSLTDGPASSLREVKTADRDAVINYAFERYYERSALLGTPERCVHVLERLGSIGVNEIACLVDFGMHLESVLESLSHLDELQWRYEAATGARPTVKSGGSEVSR
jgi:natural product biosynthesis luciferase-like monooxygenase protein